jgi:protein-disulfide isomerase
MTTEIKVFLGIGLATLLLVFGVSFLLSKKDQTTLVVSAETLVRESNHATGSAQAAVTIVEFSDFQCPACVTAEPLAKKILEKYNDRMRFVYRHFPLTQSHPLAFGAAQAAEAAGLQGKFWEMHARLFEKSPALEPENLKTYASELGLDMEKFNKDFESDAVRQKVLDDQADGNRAGINSTPTFFINGVKYSGGLSLEEFSKEIDSRLKN